MAHLTVTQRIEILIFIGCGNRTRTQQEITLSPNPQLVRLSPNLEKLVMLKIYQNQDVQKITQDKKIDIVLSTVENPRERSVEYYTLAV
ncbi:hypothetical protein NQ318_012928 [Aromia moschata]|uniref:Uncharacterized protein n=1 Tax=Aromia moschata TaxID=1265417 RepID=A0AAV8XNL6_9CUCU|nr:hypothetical protein NQ318_012928 [Aromia moschata]